MLKAVILRGGGKSGGCRSAAEVAKILSIAVPDNTRILIARMFM